MCAQWSAVYANEKPNVVVTTGMIADAASNIADDLVNIKVLMGSGVDPHAYRQTRSDIVALANANLVLWNGHPLSIYSKPLKTIVDGKIYYDLEEDKKLRNEIKKERARIISKMKNSDVRSGSRRKPVKTAHFELTCEDEYDYQSTSEN